MPNTRIGILICEDFLGSFREDIPEMSLAKNYKQKLIFQRTFFHDDKKCNLWAEKIILYRNNFLVLGGHTRNAIRGK